MTYQLCCSPSWLKDQADKGGDLPMIDVIKQVAPQGEDQVAICVDCDKAVPFLEAFFDDDGPRCQEHGQPRLDERKAKFTASVLRYVMEQAA